MMAHSESTRAIVGAVVGFAYGSILAFLSLGAAGAGHGSLVPFYLSSAPLGVLRFFGQAGFLTAFAAGAPVVWATFGTLVALSGRAKWRRLTQVLALLHYASGLALVATTLGLDELAYVERLLRTTPEFIVLWAAVYVVGQVALWLKASGRGQVGPTV